MTITITLLFLLLLQILNAGTPTASVSTTSGDLIGEVYPNYDLYLGIMYAQDTAGIKRWTRPVLNSWNGTFNASSYSPACPQSDNVTYPNQSEDCLSLNIWVPTVNASSPKEVMVYFPTRTFTEGSNSNPTFDANILSVDGNVIIVTVNSRIGLLGYLSFKFLESEDPQWPTSGNYGFLDQQLALEWVRDNIAQFGGDPSKVALYGLGAGGTSACFHYVTPSSHSLFRAAILDSATCTISGSQGPMTSVPFSKASVQGSSYLALGELACEDDIGLEMQCMRNQSIPQLLSVTFDISSQSPGPTVVVDGHLIPKSPFDHLIEGTMYSQNPGVHFMVGNAENDGTLYVPGLNFTSMTLQAFDDMLAEMFLPEFIPSIRNHYDPILLYSGNPAQAWAALYGDMYFICPQRRFLFKNYEASDQFVSYWYIFSHHPSWIHCPGIYCTELDWKVYQGVQSHFIFHNYPANISGILPTEEDLSQDLRLYWGDFVQHDKPDLYIVSGDVSWTKFAGSANPFYLNIDLPGLQMDYDFRSSQCNFWDSITILPEEPGTPPKKKIPKPAVLGAGEIFGIVMACLFVSVVGYFGYQRVYKGKTIFATDPSRGSHLSGRRSSLLSGDVYSQLHEDDSALDSEYSSPNAQALEEYPSNSGDPLDMEIHPHFSGDGNDLEDSPDTDVVDMDINMDEPEEDPLANDTSLSQEF